MSKLTVWTRQSEKILQDLNENNRYIVKREYIQEKMEEHSNLYLDVYNWYASRAQKIVPKPDDVVYPIWVSVTENSKLGPSEEHVFLELEVDRSDLVIIDQEKWGYIVNYMYLPKDKQDEAEHDALLARYQTHDTAAYLSPFYPAIKTKIIKSWDRLFDDEVIAYHDMLGTLWEIKPEWIRQIIHP